MARRKWAWVWGSVGQGVAAALIALAALSLEGATAGYAVIAALAVLAVCRAACSVSFKEILGKTVGKTRRGAVTGMAGSVSSVGVVIFAGLLMSGLFQSRGVVIAAIALAAGLWIAAALLFATMEESPSETEDSKGVDFALLKDNR
ncbi:MFS transporter, partial [Pseudomonas sp. AMR01]